MLHLIKQKQLTQTLCALDLLNAFHVFFSFSDRKLDPILESNYEEAGECQPNQAILEDDGSAKGEYDRWCFTALKTLTSREHIQKHLVTYSTCPGPSTLNRNVTLICIPGSRMNNKNVFFGNSKTNGWNCAH